MISIDCSSIPTRCRDLSVSSFPTIRLYRRDGTFDRYRGPRKESSISAFLRRALRPAPSPLTQDNLTAFTSIDEIVVLGHLGDKETTLGQRFYAMAKKYHDRFSFGVISSDGLAKSPDESSRVICYNNLDDEQHSLSYAELSASLDALELLIKRCSTPLIPKLTRRNEMELFSVSSPSPLRPYSSSIPHAQCNKLTHSL